MKTTSRITESLLILLNLPKVGVVTVRNIANTYPSHSWNLDYLLERKLIPKIEYEHVIEADKKAALVLEMCKQQDISIVSIADDTYPAPLKKIKDAPPILYVKGSLDCLQMNCAAVVGTRKASEVGLRIAEKISQMLVKKDFAVVSGLALGIDSAAHRGALKGSGTTIAILAHGLHTIAPSSNKKLAEEIIDKGGALVSEHPPGTPARPPEFVRRNRIQSGMSLFSVIVETGEVGGTIYQAQFTREQEKEAYVVIPPDEEIYNQFNSSGGRMIAAKMGGKKISSVEDLMRFLNLSHDQTDAIGFEL